MLKQNESYTALGKLHNDLDTTNYTRNTTSRLFFDLEYVSNIYLGRFGLNLGKEITILLTLAFRLHVVCSQYNTPIKKNVRNHIEYT